jgi:hypothetical protein
MVRDDLKLPDDGGEIYPNLKEEVGGLNSGWKTSSLLDEKLARWSTVSCVLALICQHYVSKKE